MFRFDKKTKKFKKVNTQQKQQVTTTAASPRVLSDGNIDLISLDIKSEDLTNNNNQNGNEVKQSCNFKNMNFQFHPQDTIKARTQVNSPIGSNRY